jgi:hypothetical protein
METKEEVFFKEGQTVWYAWGVEGVVIKDREEGPFPIIVQFPNNECRSFTHDGRMWVDNEISLFQTKPIITPNVPLVRFEKGELVWVSDDNEEWDARFFAYKAEDGFRCFIAQQKDGGTNTWKHIRKFNDNPLLENK